MPLPSDIDSLAGMLLRHRVVVLTGAGMSTESGIPDYRSPGRTRTASPMTYREFVDSAASRERYWTRSSVGWSRVRDARPNEGHRALAALERAGRIEGVITQNVDGLHQAGGARRVVELHGSLQHVRCLGCDARVSRAHLHGVLLSRNPHLTHLAAPSAPDGDADVVPTTGLDVPACAGCGGVLKPDVVFFGENVPRTTLEDAWRVFDEADALLVLGSSLAVYSGYRFVRRARERAMPVAIVNRGPTRGDADAALRVDAALGAVLPALAAALATPRSGRPVG